MRTNTDKIRIGPRGTDDGSFNGSIDELVIDDNPWSLAQVKNNYAAAKGFF